MANNFSGYTSDSIATATMATYRTNHTIHVWSRDVIMRVSALGVLIVATLVGNICLIMVINCCASLRHKRVSIFLLNLAGADLLVCCFTMTSEILFVAFGEWVLGGVACKVIVYVQIVTLASTTFILTAMSIDRYQVLVQPFHSLKGSGLVRKKITIAWLLALAFAIPQLFIFTQKEIEIDSIRVKSCVSAGYTREWMRKVYFSFLTSYILVIPAAIMSFCYISIIKVVFARTKDGSCLNAPKLHFVTSRKSGGTGSNQDPSTPELKTLNRKGKPAASVFNSYEGPCSTLRSQAMASKRNVVKMTLSVIICFLACWTPYFVISLIRIYSEYRIKLTAALSFSEILGLVHSTLNPILYMIFSQKTLKMIRVRIKCFSAFDRKSRNVLQKDHKVREQRNHLKLNNVETQNGTREKKSPIELVCRCSFSVIKEPHDSNPFHSNEYPSFIKSRSNKNINNSN